MNLSKFLTEIDSITNTMSKYELSDFVHDAARVLPESMRADFLNRLKEIHAPDNKKEKPEHLAGQDIPGKYEFLKEKLQRIQNGELGLTGSLNEEYDDWYNSDEDEFIYEDPEGVLNILKEACGFVHRCIDCEEYKIGHEISEILIGLEITVGGEYLDYTDEPLSIDELEDHNFHGLNYKGLVVDALYIAYCANERSERADALYRIFENSGMNGITLEMVMQSGEELPEMEDFLKLWIACLGTKSSAKAQRLLKEAVELSNDPEQLLENARTYYIQHPALYEQYILSNMEKEDYRKLYAAGEEALEVIDSKYVVRSRIALLMSRMALELGREKDAQRCWLEAFRSDTRVVNYLRLFVECRDFSEVENETKNIYHALYPQKNKNIYVYGSDGELRENQVSTADLYMLSFLGKEFQYVADHGMNTKDSLGWSTTFMKCGLAAFLLLLLESESLMPGCREMCRKVESSIAFSAEEYQNGLSETIAEGNQELFWKCFCRWKNTGVISQGEKLKYIHWVEKLTEKRVEGIMEGNHRKYYGECAAYIAALGEVKESRGEPGGKQRILLEYKTRYSRRSAFHGELRSFGMQDSRKR